jgi:hypothetical protein
VQILETRSAVFFFFGLLPLPSADGKEHPEIHNAKGHIGWLGHK